MPEEHLWPFSSVSIVQFEFELFSSVSIVEFEQINVCWERNNFWICFQSFEFTYHFCKTAWQIRCLIINFLASIYSFKVNNRNTRKRCEISSKLTIKTPEPCQWQQWGQHFVDFQQVNVSWVFLIFLVTDREIRVGQQPRICLLKSKEIKVVSSIKVQVGSCALVYFFDNDLSQLLFVQIINRNSRIVCKICSKLTLKTPEFHHWGNCQLSLRWLASLW